MKKTRSMYDIQCREESYVYKGSHRVKESYLKNWIPVYTWRRNVLLPIKRGQYESMLTTADLSGAPTQSPRDIRKDGGVCK